MNCFFSLVKKQFHFKMKKQFISNLEWKYGPCRSEIRLHVLCSLIFIYTVHKSFLSRQQYRTRIERRCIISIKLTPFPKRHILDASKLKEFADNNFEFGENLQMGGNHCGTRRNCSNCAGYPESMHFSNA